MVRYEAVLAARELKLSLRRYYRLTATRCIGSLWFMHQTKQPLPAKRRRLVAAGYVPKNLAAILRARAEKAVRS
jgi:hypothetical protein